MRRTAEGLGFARCDLVALLAVASVSFALAAPGLNSASMHGRDCAMNLRSLGRAVQVFALDHSDRLPGCQHAPPSWIESLALYCSAEAYVCPAGLNRVNVALNDFLTPHPHGARKLDYTYLSAIPVPSGTLLFAEGSPGYLEMKYDHFHFADSVENGFTPPRFREQVDLERHGPAANYLFPDGHVEKIPASRVLRAIRTPRSFFVHPEGASGFECAGHSEIFTSWY